MLKNEIVNIGGRTLEGVKVDLPNAPVLMITGEKGFVGCGYFKIEVADKFSHALAIVSGVRSFNDVLKGKVTAVSKKAAELGITIGMSGADACKLLA